jgi:protoheme IX farnesyltransferase
MSKNRIKETAAVYSDLIKYKLSFAVTLSSVTGYIIFQNHFDVSFFLLVCGVFLLASGSAVLNQYSELRFDALMGRTMQRPLPMKKISLNAALLVTIIFFFTGILFLLLTGVVPALLGLLAVFLYNFAYTKLKRVTSLAIIPGALVGAIPPLIGFEAAGGEVPGYGILLFSSFMFLWQLPHFMLILLKYKKEYEEAGFITLSQRMNDSQIRVLVFFWVLISTFMLVIISISGIVFDKKISLILIPLNITFISAFYYFLFRKTEKNETAGAFMLINSFSLAIMIIFIVNSFL